MVGVASPGRPGSTGNLALDVLVRQAENRLAAAEAAREASGFTPESSSPQAGYLRRAPPPDSADAGAGAAHPSFLQGPGTPSFSGCIEPRATPALGAIFRGAKLPQSGLRRAKSEFPVRDSSSSTALQAWVSRQLHEFREAQQAAQAKLQSQIDEQQRLQGDEVQQRLEAHLRSASASLHDFEAKVEALSRRADCKPDHALGLRRLVGEHTSELEEQAASLSKMGHCVEQLNERLAKGLPEVTGLETRQEALEASVKELEVRFLKQVDDLEVARAAAGPVELLDLQSQQKALEAQFLERIESLEVRSLALETRQRSAEGSSAEREAKFLRCLEGLQEEAGRSADARKAEEQRRWDALSRSSATGLRDLEVAFSVKLATTSSELKECREQVAVLAEQEKAAREAFHRSVSSRLAEEGNLRETRRAALQATLDALHAEHAVELDGLQRRVLKLEDGISAAEAAVRGQEPSKAALEAELESLRRQVSQLEEQLPLTREAHEEHAKATALASETLKELESRQKRGAKLGARRPAPRTFTDQVMDLDQAKSGSEPEEEDNAADLRNREGWLFKLIETEREARAELGRVLDADRARQAEASELLREQLQQAVTLQLEEALDVAREEWQARASEALSQSIAELQVPIEAAEKAAQDAARRASFYTQELSMAEGRRLSRGRESSPLREAVAAISQQVLDLESQIEGIAQGPAQLQSPGKKGALEALRRELREEMLAELDEVRSDLHGAETAARRQAAEARLALSSQLEGSLEGILADRMGPLERRLEACEAKAGPASQARAQPGRSPSLRRSPSRTRGSEPLPRRSLEGASAAFRARRSSSTEQMVKEQIS